LTRDHLARATGHARGVDLRGPRVRDARRGGLDLLLTTAVAQHGAGELLLGSVLTTLAQSTHPFESEAERGSGHGPLLDRPRPALSRPGHLSDPRGCGEKGPSRGQNPPRPTISGCGSGWPWPRWRHFRRSRRLPRPHRTHGTRRFCAGPPSGATAPSIGSSCRRASTLPATTCATCARSSPTRRDVRCRCPAPHGYALRSSWPAAT